MEFLGVGPLELFFILVVALIVLGPKDMVKAGRTMGSFLRRVVKSPTWMAVQRTSRDLRYLPNKLMRDAGLEEDIEELKKIGQEVDKLGHVKESLSGDLDKVGSELNTGLSAWTTPPTIESPPAPALEPGEAPRPSDPGPVQGTEQPESSENKPTTP
jgi:sec-independent protein translocase protein TatB